jgi:hypothetical protein
MDILKWVEAVATTDVMVNPRPIIKERNTAEPFLWRPLSPLPLLLPTNCTLARRAMHANLTITNLAVIDLIDVVRFR